ncbi:DUF692 domain-containing protein [Crenobacter cavernae]|uniref:UPF0276 protein DWG20_09100 n=1 Tax=Crenobacter cavernae TaxID=2290923 RepID=A0A345Y6N4_9NEIS|nr:DUF692 domain-containing protein [Crenobacter cavernae]AXK39586.1 DUF692 domain-containing protein [Crenobacter cavernae]
MTATLPLRAGIGLRAPHYREVLETLEAGPDLHWIEVHGENFFGGGTPLAMLSRLAERYPLSLHGVGLGLGSFDPPDPGHLTALKTLADAIGPASVSEHLCLNHAGGHYANDLLPLPYTETMLARVADHVSAAQDALGRRLLLENLSSYLSYPDNEMGEGEFLAELARRTGCGLLLDVNNLYVNQQNLGADVGAFFAALPADAIGEMHLAGFSERDGLLIDTHSRPVYEPVWALYQQALERFGPRPTLIEWDLDIPPLATLTAEAARADTYLEACTR